MEAQILMKNNDYNAFLNPCKFLRLAFEKTKPTNK